jgi:NitT/TauT family transport system ATP-binding protein
MTDATAMAADVQATPAPALALEHVSMAFATPDGPVAALDDVSLEVAPGEFVAVIGPSGCGKSTLFNIVGGLVDGYQGRVLIDGAPATGTAGARAGAGAAGAGKRAIGMVFQEESTFPWRTCLDNVAFPLEVAGLPRAEREERARHFLRLVGLEGFEKRYPSELSGGMRQRTAIARALAFAPRIMLMDEPFAALDEQTRILLGDKVLQIWRTLKQTTLLITHNITEAVQLADRVVVMTFRPGRIKRIVPIDLPRPRSSEIVGSAAFGRLVGEIWNDLREEAMRGMSASEGGEGRTD